jgi:hypothetical protein
MSLFQRHQGPTMLKLKPVPSNRLVLHMVPLYQEMKVLATTCFYWKTLNVFILMTLNTWR